MQKELDGGLILRSISGGHADDPEGLVSFYKQVFGESGDDDIENMGEWTRDLLAGHPTTTGDDIWVVVDPEQDDKIVSALLLIPQTWYYEDIPFGLGRIELVATDKNYRRRGLIRQLMDTAHARSTQLGHTVQGITGIPNYYRRFGYGMSLELGTLGSLPFDSIPSLTADAEQVYTLRPATEDDAEQIATWDEAEIGDGLTVRRDAEIWRYEINGRRRESNIYHYPHIIQRGDEPVGYVMIATIPELPYFNLSQYIVGPKASYLATFDDVLRELKRIKDQIHTNAEKTRPHMINFSAILPDVVWTLIRKLGSGSLRFYTYAWYMRVPDLGAFARQIAPVLERRLDGSAAHRYTGTLKIGFFDFTGLTLTFEDGKLKEATQGQMSDDDAHAAYPYHSFLDVVFGHRTTLELGRILPDVYSSRTAHVLIDILFPLQKNRTYPIA
jgi:GNAT superfamily N-acetyltransferase